MCRDDEAGVNITLAVLVWWERLRVTELNVVLDRTGAAHIVDGRNLLPFPIYTVVSKLIAVVIGQD
jgi:hypothetical protein